MTRFIKLKYIIVFMVTLAVITSVTAFSVSYAQWTGGSDSVSATVSTGEWKESVRELSTIDDKQAKDILEESLKADSIEIPDNNAQLGGLIGINDSSVAAAVWQNTNGVDGYTVNIYMKAGTTFLLCVFNRIVDPTNMDKRKGQDGYAVIKKAEEVSYHSANEGLTDNERLVFTAQKDGWYTIDVREGNNSWNILSDDYNKHDIVNISYSEQKPI